jgi:uncharacterized repeat protein (TIGR03803 family)
MDTFSQCTLIGVTGLGGGDIGTIFSLPVGDTIFSQQYNLKCLPGANGQYGKPVPGPNGKLYGMLANEGFYNKGTIFIYDTLTHTMTKGVDLKSSGNASLCLAANGKFYGLLPGGGSSGIGVVFEFDPATNTYTDKQTFWITSTDGSNPYGSLVEASNGKLYGMTNSGGANNKGVIFEYDYVNDIMTKILDLSTTTGANPFGTLIEGNSGKLYGLTSAGGISSGGTIFEFDPGTSAFVKKYDLGGLDGSGAYGDLLEASNGLFYGVTPYGGTNGKGVLFEYDMLNNIFTKKVDMVNASTGSNSFGSLSKGNNGKLYALVSTGGSNNFGTLIEYDLVNDTCITRFNFDKVNGNLPRGSMLCTGNSLFGYTYVGGSAGRGVLFEYKIDSLLMHKRINLFESEAGNPYTSPFKASNGKYYGVTYFGGRNNFGVLYEYDFVTNTFANKFNFDDTLHGKYSLCTFVQAANGKLYGTTTSGGAAGQGIFFEYDIMNDTLINKFDFNSGFGVGPRGALVKAPNGKYYGVANGGTNSNGIIYEYDEIADTLIKVFDLPAGSVNGSNPAFSLMLASNGLLYGLTNSGGTGNNGVIFEFDPNTFGYTKKYDFVLSTGGSPSASLIQSSNGKLYGTTTYGGGGNHGVLFEYDLIANSYIDRFDFQNVSGSGPECTLMQASDGKIYGTTNSGGAYNNGLIFAYDTTTHLVSTVLDFDIYNGKNPRYAALVEDCPQTTSITKTEITCDISVFPNPTSQIIYIKSIDAIQSVKISNTFGKTVLTSAVKIIDVSGLSNGVYFMNVDTDKGDIVKKIVIAH